jgi:hypothetical protein
VPSTGEGTPHAAASSPEHELRDQDSLQLCGFIALIGAPNVGKSTLVNALVGSKVAIVSHKVQTTRSPLRVIAIAGRSQLIFVDTPSIFAPKRRLDRAIVTSMDGRHDAMSLRSFSMPGRGIDAEAGASSINLRISGLASPPHHQQGRSGGKISVAGDRPAGKQPGDVCCNVLVSA